MRTQSPEGLTERPLMSEPCPKPSRHQAPSTQPLGASTAPASRGSVCPEAPQMNTEKLPERCGTNPGQLKEKKKPVFKPGLEVTRYHDVSESEERGFKAVSS